MASPDVLTLRLGGDLAGKIDAEEFLEELRQHVIERVGGSTYMLLDAGAEKIVAPALVPFLLEVDLPLEAVSAETPVEDAAKSVAMLVQSHALAQGAAAESAPAPSGRWRMRLRSLQLATTATSSARMLLAERLDEQEAAVALRPLASLHPLLMAAGAIRFVSDKERYPWPESLDGHWRRTYEAHFRWQNPPAGDNSTAAAEVLLTLATDASVRPAPVGLINFLVEIGGPAVLAMILGERT